MAMSINKNNNSVGYWEIAGPSGLLVYPDKKPNWFHRQISKIALGWVWVDL